MSKRRTSYHRFLLRLKLYSFETITTAVVILLLLDFALKELEPVLKHIWHFVHSP